MIELRVELIQQYMDKQRSFADIKSILGKSTKTIRQWIAKFVIIAAIRVTLFHPNAYNK